MISIFVLTVVLSVFALAALRWGYDSSDGLESAEWKRREQRTWFSTRTPVFPPRTLADCAGSSVASKQGIRLEKARQAA